MAETILASFIIAKKLKMIDTRVMACDIHCHQTGHKPLFETEFIKFHDAKWHL